MTDTTRPPRRSRPDVRAPGNDTSVLVPALVDSGADISVVAAEVALRLALPVVDVLQVREAGVAPRRGARGLRAGGRPRHAGRGPGPRRRGRCSGATSCAIWSWNSTVQRAADDQWCSVLGVRPQPQAPSNAVIQASRRCCVRRATSWDRSERHCQQRCHTAGPPGRSRQLRMGARQRPGPRRGGRGADGRCVRRPGDAVDPGPRRHSVRVGRRPCPRGRAGRCVEHELVTERLARPGGHDPRWRMGWSRSSFRHGGADAMLSAVLRRS